MYAADVPGVQEADIQSYMKAIHADYYLCTITLVSYPLYNDSTAAHLDNSVSVSHTFTIDCISATSNGNGPYTWSVGY
jgi:hypothetical protein